MTIKHVEIVEYLDNLIYDNCEHFLDLKRIEMPRNFEIFFSEPPMTELYTERPASFREVYKETEIYLDLKEFYSYRHEPFADGTFLMRFTKR